MKSFKNKEKGPNIMKKFKLLLLILLFLLSTKIIAAQTENHSILDKHIEWKKVYAENLASLFARIAVTYHISINFEPSKTYLNENTNAKLQALGKDREFVLKDRILKDVLNKLIELYPEYQWKIEDNIVCIFPRYDNDPIITEILETEVAEFSFQESVGKMSVGDAITDIPEIKEKLKTLKITGVHYYGNEISNEEKSKLRNIMYFKKTKVRHILNKIIKESEFKFWTILIWGQNRNFLTMLSY
jgi:hypothetical protein